MEYKKEALQAKIPLGLIVRNKNIIDERYSIKDGFIEKTKTLYFMCENTNSYFTVARLDDWKCTELYKVPSQINLSYKYKENSVYESYNLLLKKNTHIYWTPLKEDIQKYAPWTTSNMIDKCSFIFRSDYNKIDQIYVDIRTTDFDILEPIVDPLILPDYKDFHYLTFYCNEKNGWKAHGFLIGHYGEFINGVFQQQKFDLSGLLKQYGNLSNLMKANLSYLQEFQSVLKNKNPR